MPTILITGVSTGIGRASRREVRARGLERDRHRARPARYADAKLAGRGRARGARSRRRRCRRGARRTGARALRLPATCCSTTRARCSSGPMEAIGPTSSSASTASTCSASSSWRRRSCRRCASGAAASSPTSPRSAGRIVFPFFAGYNSTKWALEGDLRGAVARAQAVRHPREGDRAGLRGDGDLGQGAARPKTSRFEVSGALPPLHGGDARLRDLDQGPHLAQRTPPKRCGAP